MGFLPHHDRSIANHVWWGHLFVLVPQSDVALLEIRANSKCRRAVRYVGNVERAHVRRVCPVYASYPPPRACITAVSRPRVCAAG